MTRHPMFELGVAFRAPAMSPPCVMGVPLGEPVEATVEPAFNPRDHQEAKRRLVSRGVPGGLAEELVLSSVAFPLRIVVMDNSGSMQSGDGSRLVTDGLGRGRKVRCTRWEELVDSAVAICQFASDLGARTDFHMINTPANAPQFVTIAGGSAPISRALVVPMECGEFSRSIRAISPSGTTPLTEALVRIISLLEPAADKLRAAGQQVALTIATDGLPNDTRSFENALQRLQALPTWVVVRLCTDDKRVVDYWSELDRSLERPLEVLDDELGEAKEIQEKNRWLTYAPCLHHAREFGLRHRLFDLIDEQKLLPSQAITARASRQRQHSGDRHTPHTALPDAAGGAAYRDHPRLRASTRSRVALARLSCGARGGARLARASVRSDLAPHEAVG